MRRFRKSFGQALFAGLLLLTAAAWADDSDSNLHIEAVWKPQTVVFNYRSEGRTYSCAVLEHKIAAILYRLGAHERLQIRRNRCHDLDVQASFEARLESPIEATADNLRAITTYDTHDELLARLRGAALPGAIDIERFAAVWKPVSFRRDGKLDIDGGDCALVQQLRRQVLPLMAVRIMRDIRNIDCGDASAGIPPPRLEVVALVPANR